MLSRASGAVLTGLQAAVVTVECDVANGLPTFTLVGLPDASVSEARERVRAAVTHSGEPFPLGRITVNLAPGDLPKSGPGLDLALALSVLASSGRLPPRGLEGRLFFGELGLSGEIRGVRGALAAAEAARQCGVGEIVCAAENAAEAALSGLATYSVSTLEQACALVRGRDFRPVLPPDRAAVPRVPAVDLAHVKGQQSARYALELAAAGGHNLLLSGPPGCGKTLLAKALAGVLPMLTLDESLEVTRISSVAGLLPAGVGLLTERPFRAPHHGVSVAGMIGGGSRPIRPGEVTLAHRGVLFLDELPEFPRSVLEALRQPLEEGKVTVTRALQTAVMPAAVALVAAMNPCPCGFRNTDRACSCTPVAARNYSSRLSGPLLDRIDLQVQLARVDTDGLLSDAAEAESSEVVRRRVEDARAVAAGRGQPGPNASIPASKVKRACRLSATTRAAVVQVSERMGLSARAVHRMLRVARTSADLDRSENVETEHVYRAAQFRVVTAAEEAA